jgi:hypothetical protein
MHRPQKVDATTATDGKSAYIMFYVARDQAQTVSQPVVCMHSPLLIPVQLSVADLSAPLSYSAIYILVVSWQTELTEFNQCLLG